MNLKEKKELLEELRRRLLTDKNIGAGRLAYLESRTAELEKEIKNVEK